MQHVLFEVRCGYTVCYRSHRRVELPMGRQPDINQLGLIDERQLRCDADHL